MAKEDPNAGVIRGDIDQVVQRATGPTIPVGEAKEIPAFVEVDKSVKFRGSQSDTDALNAELAVLVDKQRLAAQKATVEARRAETVKDLATRSAAVDFTPEFFANADAKLFASLVNSKVAELKGDKPKAIVSARTAGEFVLDDLREAHKQQLIEAARKFKNPIVGKDGMTPSAENIIESNRAGKPENQGIPKAAGNLGADQASGKAVEGKWVDRIAKTPIGFSGKTLGG